jgi:hypothetical protein
MYRKMPLISISKPNIRAVKLLAGTLSLFMAAIFTNDPDNTLATDDFAITANTLN